MWKAFLFTLLGSLVLAGAPGAIALNGASGAEAAGDPSLLVTPDWLSAHLADKDLVILDAGSEKSYAKGHIPGARSAANLLSVETDGLTHEVPPPGELRRMMEALGISDDSKIVVYNQGDEFQRGTRVMFVLEVAGFGGRSHLLDGGIEAWKGSGRATTAEMTRIAPGHLSPLKMQPLVVDAAFVEAHEKAPGYDLIDGRIPILYGGVVARLSGGGHIPGAKSLPYTSMVDSEGKFKPAAELKKLFDQAGYKPGDRVIAYCHSGLKVTADILAARMLGIPFKLYDGSIEDWTRRHLPLDASSADN